MRQAIFRDVLVSVVIGIVAVAGWCAYTAIFETSKERLIKQNTDQAILITKLINDKANLIDINGKVILDKENLVKINGGLIVQVQQLEEILHAKLPVTQPTTK
jgi:hypothetical protein